MAVNQVEVASPCQLRQPQREKGAETVLDGALGQSSYLNPCLTERVSEGFMARGGHDHLASGPTKAGC
jgi:hypothetical protein